MGRLFFLPQVPHPQLVWISASLRPGAQECKGQGEASGAGGKRQENKPEILRVTASGRPRLGMQDQGDQAK